MFGIFLASMTAAQRSEAIANWKVRLFAENGEAYKAADELNMQGGERWVTRVIVGNRTI